MEKVSISRCRSYEPAEARRALVEVVAPLGGLDWVERGMKIAIKMNLITKKTPESAAVTHWSLLVELTRLLVERGAEVVIGDSPGGPFSSVYLKAAYQSSGAEAAEKAGAKLNYNTDSTTERFEPALIHKDITYTSYLKDADAIISFSKLKTHAMLGMTGATKNQFGIVPGIMKSELHYAHPVVEDFCNMLIDLDEFIKPRLCLIDAVVGMEGNGPTGGNPRYIGALIASKSPYCADVAAAHIINHKMEDLPLWQAAHKRGLAPARVEDLDLAGDPNEFRVPDFVHIDQRGVIPGGRVNALYKFARSYVARRPAVDKSLCVGCGICGKSCPAKAIKLNKYPRFDRRKCIRCFCCQELCPKHAISVYIPWITRVTS